MTGTVEVPVPPQFSPDGLFWWTGQQWVPAGTPPPPPASRELGRHAQPEPVLAPPATLIAGNGFPDPFQPMSPAAATNLVAGERVVRRTGLHWFHAYGVAGLFLVLGFSLAYAINAAGGPAGGVVALFGMATLALVGLGYLRLQTTEFVLTSSRVSGKVGIVNRRSIETLLTRVEGASVQQGPVGSLLGYGTLTVNGVGGTRESFVGVVSPQEFRKALQEQIAAVLR